MSFSTDIKNEVTRLDSTREELISVGADHIVSTPKQILNLI